MAHPPRGVPLSRENRYILAEMIRGAPKRTRETYNIEAYYDVEEEYHVVVSLIPDSLLVRLGFIDARFIEE